MHVLALSYGKNLFTQNAERERMEACANVVDDLHIIVFTRDSAHQTTHCGKLHLYPSGGKTKIGMLLSAYRIGKCILKKTEPTKWVITTQDPFESALVGFVLAKRMKIILNVQVHGDFFSTNAWRNEAWLNRVRALWANFVLKRADTVRVVSKRIKETLCKRDIDEKQIRELAVSIPLTQFLNAPKSTLARTLFPEDTLIILTVARLVPSKDIRLLVEAFSKAVQHHSNARLLIIGEGDEEEKLKMYATALGLMHTSDPYIRFLPWTNEVPAYMKSSDIYALSSQYEGYARVIPEAMAAGLPLVTTDVGCVGDVFLNKVHGEVVTVGDVDGFGKALATLVHDKALRTQYAAAGRRTAEEFNDVSTYPEAWARTLL